MSTEQKGLEFHSNGGRGKVLLDGVDVSANFSGITIDFDVGELAHVQLRGAVGKDLSAFVDLIEADVTVIERPVRQGQIVDIDPEPQRSWWRPWTW